jgi:hypothetical protein
MATITATKSVEALMHKLIDYAGLFPPAKLPLNEAFPNYLKYLNGEYSRMLANFIIPAKMMGELDELIKSSGVTDRLHFSVLGSSGETEEEFMNNLKSDITEWKKFRENNPGSHTNFYEVRLPIEVIARQEAAEVGRFIGSVSDEITGSFGDDVILFFEATPEEGTTTDEWKTDTDAVIEGIKMHNLTKKNAGYKLRTGGVIASAFPLPEQVAFAIKHCLNRQIAMKCTAGLHHPVRHFNEEVRTRMHGFINIFCSGAIAIRHNISEGEIIKMLEEEDPNSFKFTDDSFIWDKYTISVDDIKYSREALLISYGSCSFDEPIEDLQKLNLL